MKDIYLSYLTQKKDALKLSYDDLVDSTNISKSKLQRIFTGQIDVTVPDLETIVEKGFRETETELYAKMGKQEFKDSAGVDYKGAQALLKDFADEKAHIRQEYETRIIQSIKAREETQTAFHIALAQIGDQYRKNADYLNGIITDNESYIRDLLAKVETANSIAADAQKRSLDAEERADQANKRADSAENENRTTRKKMYMLFSGMLAILIIVVSFTIFLIVADVPHLGGGNLPR